MCSALQILDPHFHFVFKEHGAFSLNKGPPFAVIPYLLLFAGMGIDHIERKIHSY